MYRKIGETVINERLLARIKLCIYQKFCALKSHTFHILNVGSKCRATVLKQKYHDKTRTNKSVL